MRLLPSLALMLTLAACANQPDPCTSASAQDLEPLDVLIAETRGNLSRGYAIAVRPPEKGSVSVCVGGGNIAVSVCTNKIAGGQSGPVAIDPIVERRKLRALEARRAELMSRVDAELAACEAARRG